MLPAKGNIYYTLSLINMSKDGYTKDEMDNILNKIGLNNMIYSHDISLTRTSNKKDKHSSMVSKLYKDNEKYFPIEYYYNNNKKEILETIKYLINNSNNTEIQRSLKIVLKKIDDDKLFKTDNYKKRKRKKIFGKKFSIENLYDAIDYKSELKIEDFLNSLKINKNKYEIIKICDVIKDSTNKYDIIFDPIIDIDLWKEKSQWVYFLTFNDYIVKIGGTITGIYGRTNSYLCGTDKNRKNGTCSTTNYLIIKSCLDHLNKDVSVNIYGYKIPKHNIKIDIFGELSEVESINYKYYEKFLLDKYKSITGDKPILSNNK